MTSRGTALLLVQLALPREGRVSNKLRGMSIDRLATFYEHASPEAQEALLAVCAVGGADAALAFVRARRAVPCP